MKRNLFCGIAIAVSLGMAAPSFAQYGDDIRPLSTYRYSSYGLQEDVAPVQEPSPSDLAVPVPVPSADDTPAPMAGSAAGCAGTSLGGNYFDCDGSANCGVQLRSADRNWVVGVRGLIFNRDYEDDRGLGSNAAGEYLFTTDSRTGGMGGFETYLGMRSCTGWGWQLGYWGLYPGGGDVTFGNPPLYTALTGLANIDFNGQNVEAIFNSGDVWRVYRDNRVHNLEWNILRNGGCFTGLCGKSVQAEWLIGVRWLRFEENFRYATFTANAAYPAQLFYDLHTRNDLVGFQLGGRTDHCLGGRWSLAVGTKVGIYNNNIRHRQLIHDDAGNYATINAGPFAGRTYDYSSSKDDISMLGEIDLGLNYRISDCWRANIGYRAVGVTGVALAPGQIPYNFIDGADLQRIKSNDSLILHGAYFGVERSF